MRRFSTPHKGGRSFGGRRGTAGGVGGGCRLGSSSKRTLPTDHYNKTDRTWYCDCVPRVPADIRTVSKETKNKGRKFWKCSRDRRASCGFFLWDEDARAVEAEIEANIAARTPASTQPRLRQTQIVTTADPETPTRQAGRQRLFIGNPSALVKNDQDSSDNDDDDDDASSLSTDAQIDRDAALAAAAAATTATVNHSSSNITVSPKSPRALDRPAKSRSTLSLSPKRKRNDVEGEEDFSDGFNDADMVRDLADLVDYASSCTQQPVTPAKQCKQHAAGNGNGGLPTPVSRNTLLIARDAQDRPSSKRVRLSTPNGISSPTSSPLSRRNTLSAFRTATSTLLTTLDSNQPQEEDGESYDITRQILALLDKHIHQHLITVGHGAAATVPDLAALRSAVRICLDQEVLKIKGIKMSQATAWEGITHRNGQISILKERVAALENERTVLGRQVSEYKGRLDKCKRLLTED